MGRERNSRWSDRRDDVPLFWLTRPELFLLLLAGLFYWFQPRLPALHFAHARVHAAAKEWFGRHSANWADWVGSRRKLEETRNQLARTHSDLELAQSEIRALSLQILENDALRSLFMLPRRPQYSHVYGEIVSRRFRASEARIFVRMSPGISSQKISLAGAPVVAFAASEWAAIGQVVDVRGDLAEVMLLSDPRSRIGVTSADTPAFGSALLIGAGGDRMELDYAAHPHFMKKISSHMRLVTTLGSQFPTGLSVARLSTASGGDDVSARISPIPIIPYEELRFVVILAPVDVLSNAISDTSPVESR